MIVEIHSLTKVYEKVTALKDVSFSIEPREIVGLLGPNGAGKTTVMIMLMGLLSPTSGSIQIFGKSFERDREMILSQMNFCAPYLSFPGRLSVYENLMVFAHLYGVKRASDRVLELLSQFELEALKNRPVQRLSSGQNTRVALCKALLNRPRLLLLDEPTAYLDPRISILVKNAVLQAREQDGTAVLYTTHNMVDAEQLCDRVVFLSQGVVVGQGTPLEVTRSMLDSGQERPALSEVFLKASGGGKVSK